MQDHDHELERVEGARIIEGNEAGICPAGCSRRRLLTFGARVAAMVLGTGAAISLFDRSASADATCTWLYDRPYCDFGFTVCFDPGGDCWQYYKQYKEWCCWGPADCYYSGRKLWVPNGCCFC